MNNIITPAFEQQVHTSAHDMLTKAKCDYTLRIYGAHVDTTQCYCDPTSRTIGANLIACATYATGMGVDPMSYILASIAHEIGHAVTKGIAQYGEDMTILTYMVNDYKASPIAAQGALEELWPMMWNMEVVAWDYGTQYYTGDEQVYTHVRSICLDSYQQYHEVMNERIQAVLDTPKGSGMERILRLLK